MAWREVNLLWLLIVVAACAGFLFSAATRRRRALAGFAEAGLVDRLVIGLKARHRTLGALLRSATLALIVVAAAGPLWGFHWEEIHREGIDLLVALDTSRSMLATDVAPNRIDRAKLAILDLVGRLEGDRVGLVAFAGTGFVECPLTLDYAAFERSLRATNVGIIPRGGTAIARAIETSLEALESRQGKHEAIVLITDGEDHEGDPEAAAKVAAERGVKIYTVGIGTTEGELIPGAAEAGYLKDRSGQVVKSRLDEGVLEKVATATGGAYVRGVGDSLGLDQLFEQHLAKMERRSVGSGIERRYEPRFQIPLAAALALLVIESLLGADLRALAGALGRLGRRPSARAAAILWMFPWIVGWSVADGGPAAEGRRLYDQGKYAEAVAKYREALVEEPESALLRYNLGTTLYREGKYDEAVAAFSQVAAEEDWTARAAYNLGNAFYQIGHKAEETAPESALASYGQALLAYRRAMAADPGDEDPKYGHELVTARLRELERKIEEEKKKKEEEQASPPPADQQPETPPDEERAEEPPKEEEEQARQDQQQQKEQQAGQEPQQEAGEEQEAQEQAEQPSDEEQETQEQEAAGEEQQAASDAEQIEEQAEEQQPEQAGESGQAAAEERGDPTGEGQAGGPSGGSAESGEAAPEQPDRAAAHAVLDLAGAEELGPEEIDRGAAVAVEGGPAKDW
jgi:Ca-activated chloride channel family protein